MLATNLSRLVFSKSTVLRHSAHSKFYKTFELCCFTILQHSTAMKNKYYLAIIIGLFSIVSCQQTIIRVEKVPANTPQGSQIFITGNFNLWDPGDRTYQLIQNTDSTYFVKLPITFGTLRFKFTRGDWTTVEGDRCGNYIEDRWFESDEENITIESIASWIDLPALDCDSFTIIIAELPENTPANNQLKIAGTFNAWNPGNDERYALKPDGKGRMTVKIPIDTTNNRKKYDYKIIRNDLSESEADEYGNEIEKRTLTFDKGDTIEIKVKKWTDLVEPRLQTVTIIIPEIPKNTPPEDDIYLTGNFNNWDPGDKNYIFKNKKDGTFSITIPRKKYGLSFKITRGNWNTEAADNWRNNLQNTDYNYDDIDTVLFKVKNWKDIANSKLKQFTIVIDKIPENTPENETFYLASNYNNWNPANPKYKFTKDEFGNFFITLTEKDYELEYKITRGSWHTQEVDINFNYIENRIAKPRKKNKAIQIENWNDFDVTGLESIEIVLTKIPKKTPENDIIYIAGAFNAWNPGDSSHTLSKNKDGLWTIKLPAKYLVNGFKFTRGSWHTVETDKWGEQRDNREIKNATGKLELIIEGWDN